MKIHVSFVTNTGASREKNEDSLLIHKRILKGSSMVSPEEDILNSDKAWFVVGDGMGGEECGEEASGRTLQCLAERLPNISKIKDLAEILNYAKSLLEEIAKQRDIRLGTTLAGLYLSSTLNFVFNVGDCRVYKVTGGFLNRLTRDHSLIEEAGSNRMENIEMLKNVVTSAVMGGDCDNIQIFSRPIKPRAGDRYLVCSDGLWGALTTETLEKALQTSKIFEASKNLFAPALKSSDDNVSFIIVDIKEIF